MLDNIIQWLKNNLLEIDYQNLTKDLKWVSQDDLIIKGFAFRRKANFIDEKCHVYHDTYTKFYTGPNGEINGHEALPIKVWGARVITFIKGTPKFIRNFLSIKKQYINISIVRKGQVYNMTGPFDTTILETSWLRFKYSNRFRKFVEGIE